MIPTTCIVVDDNEMDRLNVEDYVRESESLKLIGSFSNPLECLDILKLQKVSILFLDIDMPVINGINFFKALDNPPLCVFITAFPDYAVEAFNVQAIDYLLKPVKKERFEETLRRIQEWVEIIEKALQYKMQIEQDIITVKEGNSINKVLIKDIIYVEALGNWTKIVTPGKKFITLCNLKNFLEELPGEQFYRVHRSFAVAKNKINCLQNGELQLGEYKVPLGKTYRQGLKKILCEKN
jgi:DNA-binding LytR/AlgR family response regulator